jgi:hypothetical protein
MGSFEAFDRTGRPHSALIQVATDSGNIDALVFLILDP